MNIGLHNCVADAFDGADNMNGQYKGVQAKLKEVLPRHIHTWCYAQLLNLVLQQTTSCSVTVISFFGLLQELFVFFKESYKRLNVYENQNNPSRPSHLINIGKTRSKNGGLKMMRLLKYLVVSICGMKEQRMMIESNLYMCKLYLHFIKFLLLMIFQTA